MPKKTITNRPPYVKAHKTFGDLHELLGNLGGKLNEVSRDVDREFLSSYRVHMLSIQSEIKSLREDVDKGVQALKSDGNVAKLELEVNWFVEECTRLRLHFTTMENDCLQMQGRYKSMMDQKVYMNEQLKAILKRNRVLEAEIEHALKYNQKMRLSEGENEEQSWDERNAGQKGRGERSLAQESREDVKPDAYYHEQLRRQAERSPLSTANFVPRERSSRSGRTPGSSRASSSHSRSHSRSPSRSASPSSPNRTAGILGVSGKVGLPVGDISDFDDEYIPSAQDQGYTQPLQQLSDSLPIIQHSAKSQNKPTAQSLRVASSRGDSSSYNDAMRTSQSGKSQSQRIPKPEPQPSAARKAKQKQKLHQQQQAKQQLLDFLKHKSPAEASLERAMADIFEEVQQRKVHAAKRGSIKRYPVSFTGADTLTEEEEAGGGTMMRKRAGAANASSQEALRGSTGGRATSPVMPGTALGRRLGITAHQVAQEEDVDVNAAQKRSGAVLGSGEAAMGEEEVDLLRQPLIKATGGISGLGSKQLSDNDKFSCIVKYLLDFDRFSELVSKLQEYQQ